MIHVVKVINRSFYYFIPLELFCCDQGFQRKLSQLTPEQKRLSEKLKNMTLNNRPCKHRINRSQVFLTSHEKQKQKKPTIFNCLIVLLHFVATTVSSLKVGVTEKKGACTKLRQQLEALERETAAKLAEMDRYNKDMQVRFRKDKIIQHD